MARTISIGAQGFVYLRAHGYFYVDKTDSIRQWWSGGDVSTLVCRPRPFGKTLMLSTVEAFLSSHFEGRGEELFGGLAIWEHEEYRALQGTQPVILLSFAGCKGASFGIQRRRMCEQLARAWHAHEHEIDAAGLDDYERALLQGRRDAVEVERAGTSLQRLCDLLFDATGKDSVVLLD